MDDRNREEIADPVFRSAGGISSIPHPIDRTLWTVSFFRFSLGFSGANSGKISITRSSRLTFPSVTAMPTAVAA